MSSRPRRVVRAALVAALALAAGAETCRFRASTGVDGRDRPGEDELDFRVRRFRGRLHELPRPDADGGLGRITIRGGFATPCVATSADLDADVDVEFDDVELRVRWDRPRRACATAVSLFQYEAEIEDLRSGLYDVRVEHEGDADVGLPDPVFRGTVRVR